MNLSRSVIRAYIICESIRPGTSLEDLDAKLVKVERDTVRNAVSNQPKTWSIVTFETRLEPDLLAAKFSEILDDDPNVWYTHFRAGEELFVVFPHRIFRYMAGDRTQRARAQEYAKSIGVPQIDWDEG